MVAGQIHLKFGVGGGPSIHSKNGSFLFKVLMRENGVFLVPV